MLSTVSTLYINPIQAGLFFDLLDRGGGAPEAPLSESVEATVMKL